MDCSLPGSAVLGIFQARVLEWGAIAFSGLYETGLILRCAGKAGNPFQTTQGLMIGKHLLGQERVKNVL